jgi:hypothetical protein
MKLKIKKKYFDEIKRGDKLIDFRDAHITFVCEETGEYMRKDIIDAYLIGKEALPRELYDDDMFEDDMVIAFELE